MRLPFSALARRTDSTATSQVLSPSGVIAAGVLLILFTYGLCARVLFESRNDAYNHAEENARNLMLVIERDIARNIELYGLSLQAVVDGVNDPQVMALPPNLPSGLLFDRAASGKYLGSIFVMNERSDIILDSRFIAARVGNFADRIISPFIATAAALVSSSANPTRNGCETGRSQLPWVAGLRVQTDPSEVSWSGRSASTISASCWMACLSASVARPQQSRPTGR